MLRMPDKWIYAIERVNMEPEVKDHTGDWRYHVNNWDWDEAYDSIEILRKMYTRGEAVDMVFNKNYVFVKYLATQYYPWEDGIVTFIKKSVLKREIMTLDEIWDSLEGWEVKNCEDCYGSCAQCIYRKVETEKDRRGNWFVKDIRCMYNPKNEMLQSMARGNHYCKHFICFHAILKNQNYKC